MKQFTILLPLFALKIAFSTGDIIYFPIIIRRLHGLMQRRPTMLCMFFENGFKKKKTKTEAKFGPLSTTKSLHPTPRASNCHQNCHEKMYRTILGKTTELAHCQYFAHGRDSRQAKKGCKNFWGHECRKRGIELFGIKSFSKMWFASCTSPTCVIHLSSPSLDLSY